MATRLAVVLGQLAEHTVAGVHRGQAGQVGEGQVELFGIADVRGLEAAVP